MPRQNPAERDDKVKPPDDLDRNPGIGASKGTTMAGAEPEDIEGENTFEGDVENDVSPNGAVNPRQRTHKGH
jgi:hypothetical protein